MGKLFLILTALLSIACSSKAQTVTVDDMLTLSTLSPKSFDAYLSKKGFLRSGRTLLEDNQMATVFNEKIPTITSDSILINRSVDLYEKGDDNCFAFHTSSLKEYQSECNRLANGGFFSGESKDSTGSRSRLFQRKDITIATLAATKDGTADYTFIIQKKKLPAHDQVRFAEDLLNFDSHEYLAGFFGEDNVKKDVYYFSDKILKKCSVLFGNTSQQAVFIWDDENNLRKLSYILISGVLPTVNGSSFAGSVSQNTWELKNGIHSGMSLRELLRINGEDFDFYGRNETCSFMVAPQTSGNVDFKKIGLMLDCLDCNGVGLLDKNKISGLEALDNSLALHVFYIMIKP